MRRHKNRFTREWVVSPVGMQFRIENHIQIILEKRKIESKMPVYEFVCASCQRKFRKLVGVVANPSPLECPKCQSTELNRQISRFARVRNEDDTLDSLADELESVGDSEDPKAMRRMMKEMGSALGEDLDEEFEQMLETPEGSEGTLE